MQAESASTELVLASTAPPAVQALLVEQVKNALARLETAAADEAKMIRDDAETLQSLLRARNVTQESLYPIAELKLKAERAIGSHRLALPFAQGGSRLDWGRARLMYESGMSATDIAQELDVHVNSVHFAIQNGFVRSNRRPARERGPNARIEFDKKLGIIRPRAEQWQRLAKISEERFDEIVRGLEADGADLSTNSVLYRAGIRSKVQAVERNIYRLPDGRFELRWKKNGVRHSETVNTTDIIKARTLLLRRKGLTAKERKVVDPDLSKAYSELRICLQAMDASLVKLNPSARRLVEAALSHGHRCEDALTKALNVS